MITGQEQYYWERAGYFIRRELLNWDGIENWRKFIADIHKEEVLSVEEPTDLAAVRELVQELLGPDLLTANKLRIQLHAEWGRGRIRGTPLSFDSPVEILSSAFKCVTVYIASRTDEGLLVIPGSHAEALSLDHVAALIADPSADVPGQVRMRLSAGDAICLSPALLRRRDSEAKGSCDLISLDFYQGSSLPAIRSVRQHRPR